MLTKRVTGLCGMRVHDGMLAPIDTVHQPLNRKGPSHPVYPQRTARNPSVHLEGGSWEQGGSRTSRADLSSLVEDVVQSGGYFISGKGLGHYFDQVETIDRVRDLRD